jgi:hypothetical protein
MGDKESLKMRTRYTEDWSIDGYQALMPIWIGGQHLARWVMPIEISVRAWIREIAIRLFAVALGCVASLLIASKLGLNHATMVGVAAAFVGIALWRVWECVNLPHRTRIVATREGDELVVRYTSRHLPVIRLDLSAQRYAWLERQLRGTSVVWVLQFAGARDEPDFTLDLGLHAVDSNDQRLVYDMFLEDFLDSAFGHIELVPDAHQRSLLHGLDASERPQQGEVRPRQASRHSISKTPSYYRADSRLISVVGSSSYGRPFGEAAKA